MSTNEQPEWGIKLSKLIPIPQRYIMAFLGALSIVNAYTMRNCLSVAITQMVKPRNYTKTQIASQAVCPKEEEDETTISKHGDYDWDQVTQGNVLGAFYFGYVASHLPGGILSDLFGGKWVLSFGIFSAAFFTLITPLAVKLGGPIAMMVLRVLIGLGEGTANPALSTLLSRWVPLKERGKLGAFVFSGVIVGQILGQTISGLILTNHEWPLVFYVFGIAGVLWFIFFTLMCFNDPFSHPYIRPSEKDYLLNEMGTLKRDNTKKIPWKAIMTSMPVWALILCQIGHKYGFYIMAIDMPKYMNDVLQLSVKNTGFFSSLPFLAEWISSIIVGFIADALIKYEYMDVTKVRKLMTTIASLGPAIFLVAAAYAGCDKFLVVGLFSVALFLSGPGYGGLRLTPLDLSPNYAGILMSISNGIGSIAGYFAPLLVGLLTPNTSMEEWRVVFWLAFVLLSCAALIFIIWGSGEVQEWDKPVQKEN